MRLHSSLTNVKQLLPTERQLMFELMQQCYENIQWSKFEHDLDAKDYVILVYDPSDDRLVGFSTQVLLETFVDTCQIHALFSGDTVVQPAYWGDPALAHAWGQLALELIDQNPSRKLYWFLTSKGFRTYRYLPLFFRTYYPNIVSDTPLEVTTVINALGNLIGGQRYNETSQVIHSTPDKDFVRRSFSDPGARMTNDAHVRFFVERNPGFSQGDELCCIAPLSRENFTRAAFRVINAHTADREAV